MSSKIKFLIRGIAGSLILLSLANCGGGGSDPVPVSFSDITLNNFTPDEGIFDPSPTVDGSSKLWMSFSTVTVSAVDPALEHVSTRIASSTDGGSTWTDTGLPPNSTTDFTVPDPNGGPDLNVTWRYEVSKLIYDPNDADPDRRWKILWHRLLAAVVTVNSVDVDVPLVEHSWIGLRTAPSPTGPWSDEQNLFVGSLYNSANNATAGTPLFNLTALNPGPGELENCLAYTEPGVLVKTDGLYISLKCGHDTLGKIVLIKCDSNFSSCNYLGDLLLDSEASDFAVGSQNVNGFSGSELVSIGNTDYLMVTPTESTERYYRGCLVFEIDDLASATVVRDSGKPVLIKRIDGEDGSFNGACGYHIALSNSGVLLSQLMSSTPRFHIQETGMHIP